MGVWGFGVRLGFSGFPAAWFSSSRAGSLGSPTPLPSPSRPPRAPHCSPCRQQGGGPRPYIDVLQQPYGLTESEREHLLYGVRGNTLLLRQGDPRPCKIRIKPHPQAL